MRRLAASRFSVLRSRRRRSRRNVKERRVPPSARARTHSSICSTRLDCSSCDDCMRSEAKRFTNFGHLAGRRHGSTVVVALAMVAASCCVHCRRPVSSSSLRFVVAVGGVILRVNVTK